MLLILIPWTFTLLFVPVWPRVYLPDPWYLEVGESIAASLNYHTKVDGGFASVRDVSTMQLEDHQHSFFLSETWAISIYIFFLKLKQTHSSLDKVFKTFVQMQVSISSLWWFILGWPKFCIHDWRPSSPCEKFVAWETSWDVYSEQLDII